jgi:DNA-binding beta-propeller fold protein YncE
LKERRNMFFGIIMVSLLAGLAGFLVSCCKDCPTCPDGTTQPYKGWLYATDGLTNYVYQIDTETDSLVDSVTYDTELYMPGYIAVSPDGQYLVVPYLDHWNSVYFTRIYDAQTLDIIMDLDEIITPLFADNGNKIVSPDTKTVAQYSVPGFDLISIDTIMSPDSSSRIQDYVLHESENRIYMIVSCYPEAGDSTYIMAYDYQKREVVDRWYITDDNGDWVQIHHIDVHPNLPWLYLATQEYGGIFYIACYDLEKGEFIFKTPIATYFGHCCVSPDGSEVYLTDHGLPLTPVPSPGTLFVFDAFDGAYLHGISLFGYDPILSEPLYAGYIVFTPTGEKAYVGSGLQGKRSGSVFCVNTSTRDITKLIWPDLGHYTYVLAIGPKL